MDITGHFESASCVIEVDRSATLAQVKGKLVAELGVPRARHVGVRMRGGGDIGNDDLRICDTEMDEGCAVELYCTGANITPGVIPHAEHPFIIVLSPCDRYLAIWDGIAVSVFDTASHESLYRFVSNAASCPAFSPCGGWISCVNGNTQCAEVRLAETGFMQHSFDTVRIAEEKTHTTAWSACGTKLLSWSQKTGLQVWDIATGVVVHVWDHIVKCEFTMLVVGDRVAMFGNSSKCITIWDYTTGVEVRVLTCPANVHYLALTPNQRFIAACCNKCVRVWNIETGECVFEDVSETGWTEVAVSNDVVAAYSSETLCVWSISTGKQLLHRAFENWDSYGLAISSCGGVLMYGRGEGVEIVDISHLS